MYYGLLRYAASMLVGWKSTLRRVSSLGMSGAGMVGLPNAGSSGTEDGTLGGWLQVRVEVEEMQRWAGGGRVAWWRGDRWLEHIERWGDPHHPGGRLVGVGTAVR